MKTRFFILAVSILGAAAMMGVGIASFIAAALIGGDSGKIVMVGSSVVGLYGLYQYVQ